MSRRFLELIAVAAVFVVVVVLLKLGAMPVGGQTPAAAEKAGPAPDTPWGEPDLQGIWSYDFEVPLQRPAQYANKEFFSDEEQAQLDRQRSGILNQSDRRYSRGSEQDVGGAYNAERAAALSGVPKSTVHYWARHGHLVPSVATRPRLWSFTDLLALGWQGDAPEIVELMR